MQKEKERLHRFLKTRENQQKQCLEYAKKLQELKMLKDKRRKKYEDKLKGDLLLLKEKHEQR